jgi:hypothetical protein
MLALLLIKLTQSLNVVPVVVPLLVCDCRRCAIVKILKMSRVFKNTIEGAKHRMSDTTQD